jgi:hypothetical protein
MGTVVNGTYLRPDAAEVVNAGDLFERCAAGCGAQVAFVAVSRQLHAA